MIDRGTTIKGKTSRGRLAFFALLGAMLSLNGIIFFHNWQFARQGYSDFPIFYTAGKIVAMGSGHRLYDSALQFQVQQSFASQVTTRKGPLPFNHPAFEALLFAPFTRLSFSSALAAWDLLSLLILALLPFILRPVIPLLRTFSPLLWFLILLAFPPALASLMQGQDSIVLLLLYSLAFVALRKNADILSGFWLGLGTFRFHLIVPFVFILFFCKRGKAVQSFIVTSAVVAVLSVLVTGWQQALVYPQFISQLERSGRGGIYPAFMPNLRGLIQGWSFVQASSTPLQWIVVALSLGLLAFVIIATGSPHRTSREHDLAFSLAVTATVLVGYHSYVHDLVILALPALLVTDYLAAPAILSLRSGRMRRSLMLFAPVVALSFTPLYMLLGEVLHHINLLALVLLVWMFAIGGELIVTPA